MIGLGTVVNVIAIIAGGFIGIFCKKLIREKFKTSLMHANGVCVLFIGINGALEELRKAGEGQTLQSGTLMMIIAFALGTLLGEILDIQQKMEDFGVWLRAKTGSYKDSSFVDGFVTTSLTICIGAMAIVGSIQDGIAGDHSILFAKAILDFIIVVVLASSLGKGCIFAALPVALFQGSITILAALIEPLMTEQALSNISLTGSMMIFCIGINLIWGGKIKVANMLPTILFAVIMAFAG